MYVVIEKNFGYMFVNVWKELLKIKGEFEIKLLITRC